MSKNKGFSNTSAQRYSLALYELSSEAKSLNEIEKHSFAILNLIKTSKDFNNFIKDPTENQENLILVINKISDAFKVYNHEEKFSILNSCLRVIILSFNALKKKILSIRY